MSARGEFAWIDRLGEILAESAAPAAGIGIGDDAAVIEGPGGEPWAWTVDVLVEDRHFRLDWFEPRNVGRRALVASLGDLAAMGAEPAGALVTMAGPAATFERAAEGIYRGLADAARESGCPILGGDLARADGPLHLDVTMIGPVVAGPPLTRSGARPGDEVWITGRLGGPAAAIAALRDAASDRERLEGIRETDAFRRLVGVDARIAEARWLRDRVELHAGIDVSDGVSGDAGHVAERSGVRIVLEAGAIPVHPGAAGTAAALDVDPLRWALHGGEEWELLLVAASGALGPLAEPFETAFGLPLTRIGEVVEGEGVTVRGDGEERELESESWDHFRDDGSPLARAEPDL